MTSTTSSDTTSGNHDENNKEEKTKSLNPITDTKSSTWNKSNEMEEVGQQDEDKDVYNVLQVTMFASLLTARLGLARAIP